MKHCKCSLHWGTEHANCKIDYQSKVFRRLGHLARLFDLNNAVSRKYAQKVSTSYYNTKHQLRSRSACSSLTHDSSSSLAKSYSCRRRAIHSCYISRLNNPISSSVAFFKLSLAFALVALSYRIMCWRDWISSPTSSTSLLYAYLKQVSYLCASILFSCQIILNLVKVLPVLFKRLHLIVGTVRRNLVVADL